MLLCQKLVSCKCGGEIILRSSLEVDTTNGQFQCSICKTLYSMVEKCGGAIRRKIENNRVVFCFCEVCGAQYPIDTLTKYESQFAVSRVL